MVVMLLEGLAYGRKMTLMLAEIGMEVNEEGALIDAFAV